MTTTPGTASTSDARKRLAENTSTTVTPMLDPADVERARGIENATLRGTLNRVRAFHTQWGDTDADDLDVQDLWETLGRLLDGGVR